MLCARCPAAQGCPVAREDAWERHLRASLDSWQAAAGKAGGGGAKDRAKAAAAVLERYLAEEAQVRGQGGCRTRCGFLGSPRSSLTLVCC